MTCPATGVGLCLSFVPFKFLVRLWMGHKTVPSSLLLDASHLLSLRGLGVTETMNCPLPPTLITLRLEMVGNIFWSQTHTLSPRRGSYELRTYCAPGHGPDFSKH